ncbi:hypothetical protein VTJ49DRAFT_5518 [Mycothermus thermophilus]|uniref:FAD-binding domain-containing protein n=1 Tax=Humicola insolens TaxID=85995 RepID=A0ABR3VLT8_HUMIN
MDGTKGDRFRVVISGAGVAGLTLASALEKAGVDYVLLERRDEVAPQIGASIGIFPCSARILDQLGAWKDVKKLCEPLQVFYSRNGKGQLVATPDRSPRLMQARTGYGSAWGERQNLLKGILGSIKDRSRILVNKKVVDVKHDADGVTVICDDGSSYRADLLVGADGAYSKTRQKMWELAESEKPEIVRSDKDRMTAEHNCIFGIAKGVDSPKIKAGDVNTTYDIGRCALTIIADNGTVYWFGQERLGRTHRVGDMPRYTDDDARAFIARNGDIVIVPGTGGLTLADLWAKTVTFRLVPIEEAKFNLWHWGRIACAGDSVHKATPNLGLGGNSAIETAAALVNAINRLADAQNTTGRRPTVAEIDAAMAQYQRERVVRAMGVVDASARLTRLQNMRGLGAKLFVKFVRPRLTEFLPETLSNTMVGAAKLDFLPLPKTSLTGTMPFNPTMNDGVGGSKLHRMLFALPLLALVFIAGSVMDATPVGHLAAAVRDGGVIPSIRDHVPILRSFYHIPSFDDFLALVNTFFYPSMFGTDPAARRQMISFITDGAVLQTIWHFESARRASLLTPMQLPNFFSLLGQVLGLGVVAPVYCFLHYLLTPVELFSALDRRLTNTRVSYASLPAVLLAYLLPFYALCFWPNLVGRQCWLFLWQLYPVWLALVRWGVSKVCLKETMDMDKIQRPLKDLNVMKGYVGGVSVLAAGVWWWAVLGGMQQAGGLAAVLTSVWNTFVPHGLPSWSVGSFERFASEFLRWDQVFAFGSHLAWLAYLFWDMRKVGMLGEGMLKTVILGAVLVPLVGPGATLGIGWLFREHILATRRHKDALTLESVR